MESAPSSALYFVAFVVKPLVVNSLCRFFICQQLLIEKFREFARDTTNTGTERVAATNAVCDQLIGTGHSDAATIAEWKDQINESWAVLLELIETRTKVGEKFLLLWSFESFSIEYLIHQNLKKRHI